MRICKSALSSFGLLLSFGTGLLSGLTTSAHATDYYIAPDMPLTISSVSSADIVYFSVLPGHSYCLEVQTMTPAPWASSQALGSIDPNLIGVTSTRGGASPQIYPNFINGITPAARKCFFGAPAGTTVSSYRAQSTFSFSSGASASTTLVQLLDSTLIGGFNTSVTDFNFLELTNTLTKNTRDAGTISGRISAKNVLTDTIVLSQSFTVNAGDRIDISLHDAVGPDTFGIVTVTHDGPAGSLKGFVSQYRIVSQSPLDFRPMIQQPLLRTTGLP